MHTLVKGAAGQVLAVGAERDAVDRFLVFGECVDAHAALHVPQPDSGIERSTRRKGGNITTDTGSFLLFL